MASAGLGWNGGRHAQGSEPGPAKSPARHLGLLTGSQADQLRAEQEASLIPTPENARKWLRILTREPHVAGTPADYKTAIFVRDKLREWGWKADLAELEVLLNYPKSGEPPRLALTQPVKKRLSLDELPVSIDKDSSSSDALGAFHGYGVSGSAAGQVIYVNYGRQEDYNTLDQLGIDVKDKVVLARYGSLFRGLKVRNAQKRGARGILIFSDPGDDGFAKGDVYPAGRFRPGSAIQRGSVQFLSLGPGDPSTPFGPSIAGAKRLPIDEWTGFPLETGATNFRTAPPKISVADWEKASGFKRDDYYATIPSLPLSYDSALEILKHLAGPAAPEGWQGGLPIPYHVGPGPAELTFSITHDYKIRKIWNVIATISGTVEPDRWIMLGNHRDAWVYGAVDPGSGTAATLETCRALGTAVKNGWKPKRSLYYTSWDAEEYGLVGSTEWGEQHAQEIQQKAIMLLNVDSAVSGPELSLSGVPSLRDLTLESADAITDYRSGKSLKQLWVDSRRKAWASGSPLVLADPFWERAPSESAKDAKAGSLPRHDFFPQMEPLGSGSDYTVFLDHLGIPSIDAGFQGGYGVYHSMYDNFTWMEKVGDPEFLAHATSARLYTKIVMRAAGAEIVPFTFTPYARALQDYVDQLRLIELHRTRKTEAVVKDGEPERELDGFKTLASAVWRFARAARELDTTLEKLNTLDKVASADLKLVNNALGVFERSFLLDTGLPDRPWFKHAVYAPGLTTGYAAWPLPAVRGAVEEKSSKKLATEIGRTVERIDNAAAALRLAQQRAQAILDKPKTASEKH
jgi:N-acetylated-alpha-linked acidic dipeptidase